jgi:hypothetical protein
MFWRIAQPLLWEYAVECGSGGVQERGCAIVR